MGVLQSNVITKTDFSANGQTLELDVANLNTVRFEFVGTYAFTAAFESLGMDGITWYPMQVAQVDASTIVTSHSTASATRAYEGNCSAVSKVRIRLTAFTSAGTHSVGIAATDAPIDPAPVTVLGAGSAVIGAITNVIPGVAATNLGKAEDAVAASGDVGIFQLGVRRDAPTISASAAGDYNEMAVTRHGALYTQAVDGMKRTYAAGFKLTPVVGAVMEIFGAASTTVEVNRITMTLFGTAAGKVDFILNKRSAVTTGGTAITAPTKVPYDSADAAAVSTVKGFTAAPTLSGLVGIVRQGMLAVPAANQPSDRIKIESGGYAKSLTLASATQALTLELAGTVPTGAELAIDIEWTEY